MTVAELIGELSAIDPDRLVVMSKDSEGNGYSPLSSLSENAYKAERPWCGEIGIETLTDEARKAGYSEEDVLEGGVSAVVLWPIN